MYKSEQKPIAQRWSKGGKERSKLMNWQKTVNLVFSSAEYRTWGTAGWIEHVWKRKQQEEGNRKLLSLLDPDRTFFCRKGRVETSIIAMSKLCKSSRRQGEEEGSHIYATVAALSPNTIPVRVVGRKEEFSDGKDGKRSCGEAEHVSDGRSHSMIRVQ